MAWLKKLFGLAERDGPTCDAENFVAELVAKESRINKAGLVDGTHYVDHAERVKQLKREKRFSEAIVLLLSLIDATEAEARVAGEGWGVAPWYYEQLAIIYRKEKNLDAEISILERYEAQPKARGVGPRKLAERLAKARARVLSEPSP